jgi:hypothetical protein
VSTDYRTFSLQLYIRTERERIFLLIFYIQKSRLLLPQVFVSSALEEQRLLLTVQKNVYCHVWRFVRAVQKKKTEHNRLQPVTSRGRIREIRQHQLLT